MLKPSVNLFANGKLILTAEYFVLHGAKALALPVKYGQSLTVSPYSESAEQPDKLQTSGAGSAFKWKSYFKDRLWFSAKLDATDFDIIQSSDLRTAETLVQLLETVKVLNPGFMIEPGTEIKTELDFDPQWGLGSSSTLVSNLAEWAGVDPFVLNEKVFRGSGFDIACASANGPVFYTNGQKADPVELNYLFTENLFLVYSGKKQATREAISRRNANVPNEKIAEISLLTEKFASCSDLGEFQQLIHRHEKEVGKLIGQVPVQKRLFSDFQGAIKSLGAWGGDFLLAATEWDTEKLYGYFAEKGMTEVFRWRDMVKYRVLDNLG
ncbi:MAG: GYDIA family GHMP kinase [Prolixibacteraceae bacterium]|jgi:mevalonate kinase|nr:GYDIA family GHMP kinase [Prolixibacteraceae bacterium]